MSDSPSSPRCTIREPATGKPVGTVVTADNNGILQAIFDARTGQKHWSKLDADARALALSRWRGLIVENGAALATLLSRENGKPYHESLLHEVVALVDALDYVASTAPALQRPQSTTPRWFKHRTHILQRRARGVVALITPFNFPLLIPGADAAAALAMGSAVILKPSPHCPLVAQRLVELAHMAGIPHHVFQVLHGEAWVGAALVDGDVNEVIFTGSVENGRRIARSCGERLIACTLELGGNCPLLVLDHADLDRTARAITCGAMTNSGQSCLAVGRVLVPRHLARPLVERLTQLLGKLRQGDPVAGSVDLGALTTRQQVQRCQVHVEQAERMGARGISIYVDHDPAGNFFAPTILEGCDPECAAFRTETFGPVLPIVCFDSLDSAVELLNQDRAGLTAYVFGSDLEHAQRVAERLDFGQVVVDQVLLTYVCPEVPLAGIRDSGLGVVHGVDGLLSRTTPAVIGMPRVRLPSTLEFDWNDPKRAQITAEGYLSSQLTWKKMLRWTNR